MTDHVGASFTVAVRVGVQFCPGAPHDPDEQHTEDYIEAIYVVRPPMDDVPDWPPRTEPAQDLARAAMLESVVALLQGGMGAIPGSTFLKWGEEETP